MILAEQLMIEHRLIERVMDKLDRHIETTCDVTQIDVSLIKQGIEFLEQYAEYCHRGKEENYLFKALEGEELTTKHQQVLKELMEEHGIARAMVESLAISAEKASQGDKGAYQDIAELVKELASFYRLHFEKEGKKLLHEHYRLLADSWEKTPETAGNSTAAASGLQDVYECSVCGYQYDPKLGDPSNGIIPGLSFSVLPDDWVCPLCQAGKDMFNKFKIKEEVNPAEGKQELVKKYQNQDIIIHWYPQQCSHAGKCWGGLPMVFKPQERPWVDLTASSSEEIIRTIDKCPSQALKYELPPGSSIDPALAKGPGSVHYKIDQNAAVKIRMIKDGPLLVEGAARVFDATNRLLKEADRFVLCRCGKTNNPPYCDGRHIHKEGV